MRECPVAVRPASGGRGSSGRLSTSAPCRCLGTWRLLQDQPQDWGHRHAGPQVRACGRRSSRSPEASGRGGVPPVTRAPALGPPVSLLGQFPEGPVHLPCPAVVAQEALGGKQLAKARQ